MSANYPDPVRRPLKIFAYDPMLGRMPLHRITVDVRNERLRPGPWGSRVHVLDYDGVAGCFYEPVDLDDPAVLMQGGLEPTESDPRFHQQMVYAVAMKTVENFEVALGRKFHFRGRRPLKVFPHAFRGANAFFSARRNALLFGYFLADDERPGDNAPGQPIFSCLSHDIVAHEMTHAVTHRLRRYFLHPSNEDVLAFHEGFADVIAIFQHFSFPDILHDTLRRTRGDLRSPSPLIELAEQFGHATGGGTALRSAIDTPTPSAYRATVGAHARGSVLVAAVFDAFFRTYQGRIDDLLRLAGGGTGRLPEGDLHPDLVRRIAGEATAAATSALRMCIRAFDFLPPVDITFGDYLRAMITADFELNPADEAGLRRNMVEAFRIRGIYPLGADSLSEGSLRWPRFDRAHSDRMKLPVEVIDYFQRVFIREAAETSRNSALDGLESDPVEATDEDDEELKKQYPRINDWAQRHRDALHLDRDAKIEIVGLHSSFRVGRDGQLLVEMVLQLAQRQKPNQPAAGVAYGGVPVLGGTTIVVKANGQIQYVIAKPFPHDRLDAAARALADGRIERQASYVAALDARDGFSPWQDDDAYHRDRVARRVTLAAAHRGIL